jgi:hypothetical protein
MCSTVYGSIPSTAAMSTLRYSPQSLRLNEHQGFPPRVKLTTHLHLVLKVRISVAVPPLPYTSPWHGLQCLYRFTVCPHTSRQYRTLRVPLAVLYLRVPLAVLYLRVPPAVLYLRVPPAVLYLRVPPAVLYLRVPPAVLYLKVPPAVWYLTLPPAGPYLKSPTGSTVP